MEPVDLLGDISHLRLSEGSSDNDSSLSAVSTTPPLSPDWPGDPAEGEGGAAFEGPTSDVRRETYEAWGTRRTGRCVGWDAVKGRGVILDERWGAHAGPITTHADQLYTVGEKRLCAGESVEYRLELVGKKLCAEDVCAPDRGPCGPGPAGPERRSVVTAKTALKLESLKAEREDWRQEMARLKAARSAKTTAESSRNLPTRPSQSPRKSWGNGAPALGKRSAAPKVGSRFTSTSTPRRLAPWHAAVLLARQSTSAPFFKPPPLIKTTKSVPFRKPKLHPPSFAFTAQTLTHPPSLPRVNLPRLRRPATPLPVVRLPKSRHMAMARAFVAA